MALYFGMCVCTFVRMSICFSVCVCSLSVSVSVSVSVCLCVVCVCVSVPACLLAFLTACPSVRQSVGIYDLCLSLSLYLSIFLSLPFFLPPFCPAYDTHGCVLSFRPVLAAFNTVEQ